MNFKLQIINKKNLPNLFAKTFQNLFQNKIRKLLQFLKSTDPHNQSLILLKHHLLVFKFFSIIRNIH